MKIISVTSPQYVDINHTVIDVVLDTDEYGIIPFTATSYDTEDLGKSIHAKALAGDFGTIKPFAPKIKTPDDLKNEENAKIKNILEQLKADIFPSMIEFLSTMPGAPKTIKDAALLLAAEKTKIKI